MRATLLYTAQVYGDARVERIVSLLEYVEQQVDAERTEIAIPWRETPTPRVD